MRILADENLPALAVEALRHAGHDVRWVGRDSPGSSDRDVIRQATGQERLLVTFDKDFGELAFREHHGLSGVILFRISMPSAARVAEVVMAALGSRDDWEGHFAVVEDQRIRMRPLRSAHGG